MYNIFWFILCCKNKVRPQILKYCLNSGESLQNQRCKLRESFVLCWPLMNTDHGPDSKVFLTGSGILPSCWLTMIHSIRRTLKTAPYLKTAQHVSESKNYSTCAKNT